MIRDNVLSSQSIGDAKITDLPSKEQRLARLAHSRKFFHEVLLPSIREGVICGWQDVAMAHQLFRLHNVGLGDDFALAHVQQIGLQERLHVDCLRGSNPHEVLIHAASVDVSLQLLEEAIDHEHSV